MRDESWLWGSRSGPSWWQGQPYGMVEPRIHHLHLPSGQHDHAGSGKKAYETGLHWEVKEGRLSFWWDAGAFHYLR